MCFPFGWRKNDTSPLERWLLSCSSSGEMSKASLSLLSVSVESSCFTPCELLMQWDVRIAEWVERVSELVDECVLRRRWVVRRFGSTISTSSSPSSWSSYTIDLQLMIGCVWCMVDTSAAVAMVLFTVVETELPEDDWGCVGCVDAVIQRIRASYSKNIRNIVTKQNATF